jgi:hypothetical protein
MLTRYFCVPLELVELSMASRYENDATRLS